MRGRVALTALLCFALEAVAQVPERVCRIGLLGVASPATYQRQVEAFRAGLRDLGYVEGRNVVIEARWADGDAARLPQLATELVATTPDVIVTSGPGTAAAKRATSTIPIVMAAAGDAVATRLVESLSRPGGNVTGSSFLFPEINAKRLAILKEAMPSLTRVGVLVNPQGTAVEASIAAMRQASSSLGLVLHIVEAKSISDVGAAMDALVQSGARAIVVADHTVFVANAAHTPRPPPSETSRRSASSNWWSRGARLRTVSTFPTCGGWPRPTSTGFSKAHRLRCSRCNSRRGSSSW